MTEPGFLDLMLSKLEFILIGRSVYKDFAYRLALAGDERVLDFGCGMGLVAYYAAKRLPRGQLVCADFSTVRLRACGRRLLGHDNTTFHKINLDCPELPTGFDLIYCHFVLHELVKGEMASIILLLAGCLNSGGKLIFREPLRDSEKLSIIKGLLEANHLSLMDSRIADIPHKGNVLESTYIKI